MGLYIKGMEMPTHCMDCPFMVSRDNDDCILQSDEANEGFENWEQMKDHCPLIEVPPHGRLGDLDALINGHFSDEHRIAMSYADKCWMRRIINGEPTVIPAEEDKECK